MSLESLAQTRIRLIDNEPNELPKEVTRHSNQQPARKKPTRPTRCHPNTTSLYVTQVQNRER